MTLLLLYRCEVFDELDLGNEVCNARLHYNVSEDATYLLSIKTVLMPFLLTLSTLGSLFILPEIIYA